MKVLTSSAVVAISLASLLVLSPKTGSAQDPVKVAPDIYKVALENSHVRVLDIRLAPGGKIPMHSHPAFVIYALGDCKVKFTYPGGKSEEVVMTAGQAVWSKPVTHAAENVGTTELHVLNIEMKPHKAGRRAAK